MPVMGQSGLSEKGENDSSEEKEPLVANSESAKANKQDDRVSQQPATMAV